LWDGGNNDLPFFVSDLHIVLVDPHRPGHEVRYHPGEANLRLADVVIINKVETAAPEGIAQVRESVRAVNPTAAVIEAASPIYVEKPEMIRDKRVLVVEDGPTLTHGEMKYGAGVIAAQRFGAAALVDPRPYTVRSITETFQRYPDIGTLLPAMGYGQAQRDDLEETINRADADLVIVGTPVDLGRILEVNKPMLRVRYELQEIGRPTLRDVLEAKFGRKK
jgi:predicted GTPase